MYKTMYIKFFFFFWFIIKIDFMESRTRLRFWNGNTVKGSLRNDDMKTENGNMKVYCSVCLCDSSRWYNNIILVECHSKESLISETETLLPSNVLNFYTDCSFFEGRTGSKVFFLKELNFKEFFIRGAIATVFHAILACSVYCLKEWISC
jgi:hypothetical protein